jgi:hypothetical protein
MSKNKYILFLVLMLYCFISFGNNKYILRNNTIYFKPFPNNDPYSLDDSIVDVFQVNRGFFTSLNEFDQYLVFKVNSNNLKKSRTIKIDPRSKIKGSTYYFPENDSGLKRNTLRYLDGKLVLKGISITLKFRSKLDEPTRLDSFPSQVETGFNPALAFGYKFNYNIYNKNKDIFGKNLTQISLSPGLFLGTGVVSLGKSSTRDPIIVFERKAAIISPGFFLMLGYNNINIGYSIGWDFATGTGYKSWLYQGKFWQGITVGFDIIP